MMKFLPALLPAAMLLATSAHATLINFDAQGLVGPSIFANVVTSPQTLNINAGGVTATLSGGVILTQTFALPANQTSVYGTANFGTGLSNPLTLVFDHAVNNIVFDVLNGMTTTQSFIVADNLGNSQAFSIDSNLQSGAITIGLTSLATSYTITQNGGNSPWDFFIDNIQFNVDVTCTTTNCTTNPVPLPGTLPLAGLALALAGLMSRRKV